MRDTLTSMRTAEGLAGRIGALLSHRNPARIRDSRPRDRHAAVLVPLLEDQGVSKVLFIRRSDRVAYHKGQISFPGGAVEAEDADTRETALREAEEEIGLERGRVEILGPLDDARTVSSQYIVHPWVGQIPYPYPFRLDPAEVADILLVPLVVFLEGDPEDRIRDVSHGGSVYRGVAFEYGGHLIWGATARIMAGFTKILDGKIPLPGTPDLS